jgi:formylmethanofuran dehydrogenase subunit E
MVARTQAQHKAFNATHYPGTRQLCDNCGEPTERCEEDALTYNGKTLCSFCYDQCLRNEEFQSMMDKESH